MSFIDRWILKTEIVPMKNGRPLFLKRWFGRWEIHGEKDTYQTGAYMDGLWKKVLKTFPKSGVPMRVLLLGVGMGNTFNLILQRFSNARITGVEWEPALIETGRRLGILRDNPRINIVLGDAVKIAPTLEGPFDLILVDLFNGTERGVDIADAVKEPALQDACLHLLAPGGTVALNHFRSPDATKGWDDRFPTFTRMKYESNGITLYKKLP